MTRLEQSCAAALTKSLTGSRSQRRSVTCVSAAVALRRSPSTMAASLSVGGWIAWSVVLAAVTTAHSAATVVIWIVLFDPVVLVAAVNLRATCTGP